jgi:hypothetical protein
MLLEDVVEFDWMAIVYPQDDSSRALDTRSNEVGRCMSTDYAITDSCLVVPAEQSRAALSELTPVIEMRPKSIGADPIALVGKALSVVHQTRPPKLLYRMQVTWLGIKAFIVFVVVFFGSSWLLVEAEMGDTWAPVFGFWIAVASLRYYYKQSNPDD